MALQPKKKSTQRGVAYAAGGSPRGMFGQQAAGPKVPGRTGKVPSPAPGAQRAAGGPSTRGLGGVSRPALPGAAGTGTAYADGGEVVPHDAKAGPMRERRKWQPPG